MVPIRRYLSSELNMAAKIYFILVVISMAYGMPLDDVDYYDNSPAHNKAYAPSPAPRKIPPPPPFLKQEPVPVYKKHTQEETGDGAVEYDFGYGNYRPSSTGVKTHKTNIRTKENKFYGRYELLQAGAYKQVTDYSASGHSAHGSLRNSGPAEIKVVESPPQLQRVVLPNQHSKYSYSAVLPKVEFTPPQQKFYRVAAAPATSDSKIPAKKFIYASHSSQEAYNSASLDKVQYQLIPVYPVSYEQPRLVYKQAPAHSYDKA